jgi:hypothetical protein
MSYILAAAAEACGVNKSTVLRAIKSGKRSYEPPAERAGSRKTALMVGALTRPARRFQLVLIKPSHYDDDGYVIQWMRAFVPSNTLAVLYSLGRDSGLRQVLGPDTGLDITVIDEIHTRVRIKQLLALFRRHDGFGLLAIVGVQSNQYPRALDIARPFRAAGVPVMIGGFHVSGCLAMLPEMQRPEEDARPRHQHVRRRARRSDGPHSAGCGERDAEADLQLLEGSAVARVGADPHSSGRAFE